MLGTNIKIIGLNYLLDGGSVEFLILDEDTNSIVFITLDNREKSSTSGKLLYSSALFESDKPVDEFSKLRLIKALDIYKRTLDLVCYDIANH